MTAQIRTPLFSMSYKHPDLDGEFSVDACFAEPNEKVIKVYYDEAERLGFPTNLVLTMPLRSDYSLPFQAQYALKLAIHFIDDDLPHLYL